MKAATSTRYTTRHPRLTIAAVLVLCLFADRLADVAARLILGVLK
jgi:hypothetical protein